MKKGLVIVVSLFLLGSLVASCASGQSFNARLGSIVKPYTFSRIKWEFRVLASAIKTFWQQEKKIDDEINLVTQYFTLTEQAKALKSQIEAAKNSQSQNPASLEDKLKDLQGQKSALENEVEKILEKQLGEILARQGIFHPLDKYLRLKFSFPPLDFKLEKPPHLLVISPRERIESVREIALRQGFSVEEMGKIEAEVDRLGVSSLVVDLGGYSGTYPTFVTNEASLRFTLDSAAEEWLHQYLAFKPLGFMYLLDLTGIRRNYEIATLNETAASMVGKELGALVCEKYYPQYKDDEEKEAQAKKSGFDFNQEMREIRRTVDRYLAQGEIEPAEKFMEEKRKYLASQGYYLRKLNQAYFAFHGTYADRPTSISPIGAELKELRHKSASLKEFLDKVSLMTGRQDLINRLK